jgi:Uncharacterised nucleotidyltransferase
MWERIDGLLEANPARLDVLRVHRVELLEARRRRAAGLPIEPDTVADEARVAVNEMAVPGLLARIRAAYDGQLLLMKGPEVALDYGASGLRSFGDIDFLTDDAPAAQAALIAAGFQEVFEPEIYEDIHHLRPLWWPGLPLVVELHTEANWPQGIPGPSTDELLAAAVPSRLGVPGITTLPPEQHTLVLAAHAWEHQPLGRLGNLLDVAVTLQRADEAEIDRLARRWGCRRMWRTTRNAIRSLTGEGRSAATALWARHLYEVRERTVLEWHVKDLLAPVWGYPAKRVPGAVWREARRMELSRTWFALRHARRPRSEYNQAMEVAG